jgi:hypothetical protein
MAVNLLTPTTLRWSTLSMLRIKRVGKTHITIEIYQLPLSGEAEERDVEQAMTG